MLRSLYLSATNMIVQRRRMDVITNNIANVETNGFKADTLVSRSFQDMMIERIGDPAIVNRSAQVGPLNTGVHIDEVITNFEAGPLKETQRLLDFAIVGDGFFKVSTPAGERVTRDGNFFINDDGYLVNSNGYFVLGERGPIQVNPEDFTVDSQGNITSGGYAPNRMQIVTYEDISGLRKVGDNLYMNYTNQAELPAAQYELKQGFVEGSNVQIAAQVIDMMTLYRSYETSQRIVKMIDESLGKSVNEVGRV